MFLFRDPTSFRVLLSASPPKHFPRPLFPELFDSCLPNAFFLERLLTEGPLANAFFGGVGFSKRPEVDSPCQ